MTPITATTIEAELRAVTPVSLSRCLPQLAQLLADIAGGTLPIETARVQLNDPELCALVQLLANEGLPRGGDHITVGDIIGNIGVAIGPGARAEVHIFHGPSYPRPDYHIEISGRQQHYTQVFVGRELDITVLETFAASPDPGYLLIEAPAGFGKTALVANLVQRARLGEWRQPVPALVYFFVRQEGGHNTPVFFLQRINTQLLDLLKLNGGVPPDLDSLSAQFSQLWAAALQRASATHPLLLLIDGLDEIASGAMTIAKLLPSTLRPYVHVIVSSRPNPEPLEQVASDHPFRTAQVRALNTFGEAELRELLTQFGATPAVGDTLVSRVMQLTKGEPLFARFVCQEVAEQGEVRLSALEQRQPAGVEEYFNDQLNDLKQLATSKLTRQILGLLLVALRALTDEEYADVLEEGLWTIGDALQPIRRFLIGEERLELIHLQFRRAVARQYSPKEQETFRLQLLDWGRRYQNSDWSTGTPAYLLMYYSQHLIMAKQWTELFSLACDDRYLTEQHKAFHEDPTLPLQTIVAALKAAIELDDPVKMGQFILRHADYVSRSLINETPLDSLRSGSINKAVSTAKLYDFEHRVLWLLLLSWELQDAGKKDAAREVLTNVQNMKLQHLSGWSGACAAYLLLPVVELSSKVFADLGGQLLWDADSIEVTTKRAISEVSEALVQRGHYAAAIVCFADWFNDRCRVLGKIAQHKAMHGDYEDAQKTLAQIPDTAIGVAITAEAISWIATEKARAGRVDEAREDLKSALELAQNSEKQYAIVEVVVQQVQVGQLEEALHTLEQVTAPLLFVSTLKHIAVNLYEQRKEPGTVLLRASQYVRNKLEPKYKAKGLCTVAVAYAQTGQTDTARAIFEELLEQATAKGDAEELSYIAQAQAEARLFEAAVHTMNQMENNGWRTNVRKRIIEYRAKFGQLAEALEMARSTPLDLLSFVSIIKELAIGGRNIEARNILGEMLKAGSSQEVTAHAKARALSHIAGAEAQNRRFKDAYAIAQQIDNDRFFWSEALMQIAVEEVRLGEYASVKARLEELKEESDYSCSIAAAKVIAYLADNDNLVEARKFVRYIHGILDQSADKAIVVAEARAGNVVAAFEQARNLGRLAPRAIGKIVEIALRSGHADDLRKVDWTFPDSTAVIWINAWIAYAYLKAGEVSVAEVLLQQVFADIRKIEERVDRQKILCVIAVILQCTGHFDRARDTFKRACFETGFYNIDDLRGLMVEGLVEVGERMAALEQAVQIDNIYKQAKALSLLNNQPVPPGLAEAVRHVTLMIQVGHSSWLSSMAEVLVNVGDKEGFKRLLIPSPVNIDSAYSLCGLLAKLYPDHTKELLRVVHNE